MTAIEDSDHGEKLGSGDLGYSGIISSAVDSAYVPKTMEDRKLHTAIQSRRNIVLLSLSGEGSGEKQAYDSKVKNSANMVWATGG